MRREKLSEEDQAFSDAFERWRDQYRADVRAGLIDPPEEGATLERDPKAVN